MSRTAKIIATVVATLGLSIGSVGLMGGSQLVVDVSQSTVHCC